MIELLKFLIRYCQPLFESHQFEITDSQNTKSEAQIYLRNSELAILLVKKNSQLPIIYFQSLYEKSQRSWISLDKISRTLNRPTQEPYLDEANTAFLLTHITAIVNLFSKEKTAKTLNQLAKN